MFNKDFYPTPNNVIESILIGIDIIDKIVLEPSAGKGNIIDYLKEQGAKEVLSCEKDPDLAKIVAKKSNYIADDFLSVRSHDISHIDLIVMNPPFSADEKHILHAWEIAPAGCTIVALCNTNTIKNHYTTNREKLKELITNNGRYEDLGNVFSDSERATNVDVSCVYLYKEGTGESEFDGYFDMSEEYQNNDEGIVRYNYIRDIVGRYVQAVSKFDSVMEASREINEITSPIAPYGIKFGATGSGNKSNSVITREVYKNELQIACWNRVFNDMKMEKYLTKGVKDNLNAFVKKQTAVPFTVKNVYKMIELIVGTNEGRMKKVLEEAFDCICSFSAENSTAGEKWKTNSDYMINKKFIVPYICSCGKYDSKTNVNLTSYGGNRDKIEDLVRALCLLSGDNYDNIQPLYSFVRNTNNVKESYENARLLIPMQWGTWYDWQPFFRIKAFKKGTMHFEFLDPDLWARFNIEVSKSKGWKLPQTRKKQSKQTI